MFNLFGLNIHLYGLLIGIGIWIGFEIASSRKKIDSQKKELEGVLLWTILGGVIGARIYHVIDLWQRYYSQNPIKIFYVWEGGLGIWGAIGGGIIGIAIFCQINKLKILDILDDLIIGVPVAQAIGRLGNLANGELVGKNGEPLFAYEAALNLVLFVILWKVAQRKTKKGLSTGVYLIGYGVIRIALEGLRPDSIVWKLGGIPVAIVFGIISILSGMNLILSNQNRSKSKYSTGA